MPVMPVVRDPSPVFKVGDAGRIERPEPARLPGRPLGVTSVPPSRPPWADRILTGQAATSVVLPEPSGPPCRGSFPASGNRFDAQGPPYCH